MAETCPSNPRTEYQSDSTRESKDPDKETEGKVQESIHSARASPNKPPLPPRPSGHTPGKKCVPAKPLTPSHSPSRHGQPITTISQPPKTPTSPRPSRPPNPRDRAKSPEVAQTSPKVTQRSMGTSVKEAHGSSVGNEYHKRTSSKPQRPVEPSPSKGEGMVHSMGHVLDKEEGKNSTSKEHVSGNVDGSMKVEIVDQVGSQVLSSTVQRSDKNESPVFNRKKKPPVARPPKPSGRATSINHGLSELVHAEAQNENSSSTELCPKAQKIENEQSGDVATKNDTKSSEDGETENQESLDTVSGSIKEVGKDIAVDGKASNIMEDQKALNKSVKHERPDRPSLPNHDSSHGSPKHHPPPVAKRPARAATTHEKVSEELVPEVDEQPAVERRKDRKPVQFRVHSFSKTEVESFNSEMFAKKLEKGGVKEAYKPGKPPPPVLPKPATHQRPPPPKFKRVGADGKGSVERDEVKAKNVAEKVVGKIETGVSKVDEHKGDEGIVGVANEHVGNNVDEPGFNVNRYLTDEDFQLEATGNASEKLENEDSEKEIPRDDVPGVHRYDTLKYVRDFEENGTSKKDTDSKEDGKTEEVEVKANESVGKSELGDTKSLEVEVNESGTKGELKELIGEEGKGKEHLGRYGDEDVRKKDGTIVEEKGGFEKEKGSDNVAVRAKSKPAVSRPAPPNRTTSLKEDDGISIAEKKHIEVVILEDEEGARSSEKAAKPPRPTRAPSLKHYDLEQLEEQRTPSEKAHEKPPRPTRAPSVQQDDSEQPEKQLEVAAVEQKDRTPSEKGHEKPPRPTRAPSIQQDDPEQPEKQLEVAAVEQKERTPSEKGHDKPPRPTRAPSIQQDDPEQPEKQLEVAAVEQKERTPSEKGHEKPLRPTRAPSIQQDDPEQLEKQLEVAAVEQKERTPSEKGHEKPPRPTRAPSIQQDDPEQPEEQSNVERTPSEKAHNKPPRPIRAPSIKHSDPDHEVVIIEGNEETREKSKPPPRPTRAPSLKHDPHQAESDGHSTMLDNNSGIPTSVHEGTDCTVFQESSSTSSNKCKLPGKPPPPVPPQPQVEKVPEVEDVPGGRSIQMKPDKPPSPCIPKTSEPVEDEVFISDERSRVKSPDIAQRLDVECESSGEKPQQKPVKPPSPCISRKRESGVVKDSEPHKSANKPTRPLSPGIVRKTAEDKISAEQPDGQKNAEKQKSRDVSHDDVPHDQSTSDVAPNSHEMAEKSSDRAVVMAESEKVPPKKGVGSPKPSRPAPPTSPRVAKRSDMHTAHDRSEQKSDEKLRSGQKPSKPAPPSGGKVRKSDTEELSTRLYAETGHGNKPDRPASPRSAKRSEHPIGIPRSESPDELKAIRKVKRPAPPAPEDRVSEETGGEAGGTVCGQRSVDDRDDKGSVELTSKLVPSEEHVVTVVKDIEIDENGQNESEVKLHTRNVGRAGDDFELKQETSDYGQEATEGFRKLSLSGREMKNVSVDIQLEEGNGEDDTKSTSGENATDLTPEANEVSQQVNIVATRIEREEASTPREDKTSDPHECDTSTPREEVSIARNQVVESAAGMRHDDVIRAQAVAQDSTSEPKASTVTFVSSSPKKVPPPKPKRTSSLKKDSKPIVKVVRDPEVNRDSVISCDSIPEGEGAVPSASPEVPEETRDHEEKCSRNLVRSNSFTKTSTAKDPEVTACDVVDAGPNGTESGKMGRSRSFGGKMKKRRQRLARPSPPTFFVQNEKPSDISVEEPGRPVSEAASDVTPRFVAGEEPTAASKHDSILLEESSKHDSIISETSSKCDSYVGNTTDSDSSDEKEDVPQQSKTYYISREILSTERTFVDVVKLVSEDFPEAVSEGNKKFGRDIIPDETLQEIMTNITQIYQFDCQFLKTLEERMEHWEENQRIGDIIKRFSPFLKMYKTYIQGYDNAMAVLTDALKKYPQFAEVVREFECSERCQNLTVGMYMLKPIQRIPSYRLLLIDYLKHLSTDSLDHKDVSDALAIVSDVATHINEDMKRVDNFAEVLKVQRSLVGQVEIVKPGRQLIKEGILMKLSRKEMQARMFFLFTDVLLYTTPVANNQFSLNLSLPLAEIQVELPVSPDLDNEFSIISTKKSFTLSASTAEERDEWLEAFRNASDEIRKKKLTYQLAHKEKMDSMMEKLQENGEKEAKLGSKAPVWIQDGRVSMCMLCTDKFTPVSNRRHHCRACGKVVCGSCSSNTAPLAYLNFEAAKVCDNCYDELVETRPSRSKNGSSEQIKNVEDVDAKTRDPVHKISENRTGKTKKEQKKFGTRQVPAPEESRISGYLLSKKGKKWHKRWYVVKDNVLYVSKATSDVVALETCPLLGYDVRGPETMDGDSKKIIFQLIHAGTPPVVLQTDNIKSAERWVNALRRATMLRPIDGN